MTVSGAFKDRRTLSERARDFDHKVERLRDAGVLDIKEQASQALADAAALFREMAREIERRDEELGGDG
ncbi:hypothetical protein [Rhodophyticola sp.]|jgi:hypothetical protein|uniref:hypothetical protein n=1 Tax=Rhodophyticola sp. TaxID=2680032 RepID=UPI001B0C278D|nr:hypothetical protein [Roseicyclus sp.]MBO6626703.1 hypothetical protein [Roseicyclus sp.]MBO6922367.1 hypothetical protein [Roseicyclus sp.]